MPWYAYKLGGWEIAVDAVSKFDAAQHIRINAPGAEYVGEFTPGNIINGFSIATAMTTAKRQEEISQRMSE